MTEFVLNITGLIFNMTASNLKYDCIFLNMTALINWPCFWQGCHCTADSGDTVDTAEMCDNFNTSNSIDSSESVNTAGTTDTADIGDTADISVTNVSSDI